MKAQGNETIVEMVGRNSQGTYVKPAVELAGRRVLIIGLARTGFATAQFCAAQGARVTVVEERDESAVASIASGRDAHGIRDDAQRLRIRGVSVHCGGKFPELFAEADLIVPSPGVPANLPELARAREAGITIWSEIELAWRFLRGRLFAITGSNGKTTTVSLLGHILRQAQLPALVGGNIGTPLISLVEESSDSTITVAEISTFQLELAEAFRPDVAILLNITPDHLDRHGSFEEYSRLKRRIFANQRKTDDAILNGDDPSGTNLPEGPQIGWFSRNHPVPRGAYVRDGEIILCNGGVEMRVMSCRDVPLPGAHNLENALAASFAAHLAGVAPDAIASGVRSFTAVEHRLEFVAEIGGVRFYNDSKATNVDAALKALESFTQPVHIILGGKDKGGDFAALREPLCRHARRAILIGNAAGKIAGQIDGAVPIEIAGTLDAAVTLAFAGAHPGEIILLAPACASFDQFRDFEHRGRVFKGLVAGLDKNFMAGSFPRKD